MDDHRPAPVGVPVGSVVMAHQRHHREDGEDVLRLIAEKERELEAAMEQARQEAAAIVAAARAEAEAIRARARQEAEAIRARAAERAEQAVQLVVGRVLGGVADVVPVPSGGAGGGAA